MNVSRHALVLLALVSIGTNSGCGNASSTIIPPKFTVSAVKTDHGLLTAEWYITIRNEGGPGSQLVQYWAGSADDPNSRTIIYSERHYLGIAQQKTITVTWDHGGVGAVGAAILLGGADGIEFLP